MFRFSFLLLLIIISHSGISQKKKADPSSLNRNPEIDESMYGPKDSKKKKKKSGVTYEARNDFEERLEENWKQREKREKNVSGERKPDKTQPPYFGHKRPPKVRPVEKRKLCKVCGIKH